MNKPKRPRPHGEGGIDERGDNTFRLRYRVNGKRFTKTFRGSKADAQIELRALLRSGDTGEHVDPSKKTVGQWIDEWIAAGAPGRRRKKVGQRTLERYEQLLKTHAKPAIGHILLQKLRAPEIDKLYVGLEGKKIKPRTAHHVHVVLGACLATAERKGEIAKNPMLRVEQVPNPEPTVAEGEYDPENEDALGEGLDETQLAGLVGGFKPSPSMYAPVAVDAATGLRRNELLAVRWVDFNEEKKKLRIEWALEQTKKYGIRRKRPKTKRGIRTIDLDDGTVAILLAERSKWLRLTAGIPDGAEVDLSLVRLPANALIFPAVPEAGEAIDLSRPRNPRNFSKEFARRAEVIGFGATRFHDLRGVHATALLDAGQPIHRVAERLGDDPAVVLRNYMKRKRSSAADASLSATLATLSSGFLGK